MNSARLSNGGGRSVREAPQAPLAEPEHPVEEVPVTEDLYSLRKLVAESPVVSALPIQRREDFILAVDEAATNALKFGEPPRRVRLWRSGPYVVGEVVSRGEIGGPPVSRLTPPPADPQGLRLWIVNHLCDLVEVVNRDSRATLRMHMRCA
jgi:hypothetical protein